MVDQFVVALHPPISRIRLERYRPPGGPNLHMLANYFWNMDLAEALFPTLHAVEVGLRNTIHTTLTGRYNTQEWWHEPYTLGKNQHDTVVKSVLQNRDVLNRAAAEGRPGASLLRGVDKNGVRRHT